MVVVFTKVADLGGGHHMIQCHVMMEVEFGDAGSRRMLMITREA